MGINNKLIWGIWFITWVMLLVGLFDQSVYTYVVVFSVAHLLLFLVLLKFQFKAFPIQVRIAYLLWVIVGTYVPGMIILMYITTVGLAANLFLSYCPLARMMYLLPWNHEESMSFDLVKRVFFSPPVKGKFSLKH